MNDRIFTAGEKEAIYETVRDWATLAIASKHCPILMITINESDPGDVEIHCTAEYPMATLIAFLDHLVIKLKKTNDEVQHKNS